MQNQHKNPALRFVHNMQSASLYKLNHFLAKLIWSDEKRREAQKKKESVEKITNY